MKSSSIIWMASEVVDDYLSLRLAVWWASQFGLLFAIWLFSLPMFDKTSILSGTKLPIHLLLRDSDCFSSEQLPFYWSTSLESLHRKIVQLDELPCRLLKLWLAWGPCSCFYCFYPLQPSTSLALSQSFKIFYFSFARAFNRSVYIKMEGVKVNP